MSFKKKFRRIFGTVDFLILVLCVLIGIALLQELHTDRLRLENKSHQAHIKQLEQINHDLTQEIWDLKNWITNNQK